RIGKEKITRYFLWESESGKKVIANPQSVGTPKFYTINGQDIWNGNMKEYQRDAIANKIKAFFVPFLQGIKIDQFPIRVFCDVHDLIRDPLNKGQLWDMDNRFLTW